jgi:hypothetical protein
MFRSPYTTMSRSPYKELSRTPYKKCLTLLTDKRPFFCYNDGAQTGSNNIEALVVAVIREGGQYERLAADPYPGSDSRRMVGCFVVAQALAASCLDQCHLVRVLQVKRLDATALSQGRNGATSSNRIPQQGRRNKCQR